MIERIDSDVAQLATLFSQLLFTLLSQGIVLIAALALLFTIAWFIISAPEDRWASPMGMNGAFLCEGERMLHMVACFHCFC